MGAEAALARQNEHWFLSGGGELAELIAAFDWSSTSLGDISSWSVGVKTTVALILRSPIAIATLWGEDGIMIYNDAYVLVAAARHPGALGSKLRESWPEVVDFNDHAMKVGMAGGTLSYTDQEFTFYRRGHAEQVWLSLDYSPIPSETGAPLGVMAIVVETTGKVLAERWRDGERGRLRRMFEQAPGFVAMLSGPNHVFDLVNPAYLQLIGHRDVLGKPVMEALPELLGQGFIELLDGGYSTGKAFSGASLPVALQRAPGGEPEQRYIDLVYQPITDEGGTVIGIFVQGADVTNRVRAEQEARESEAQFRTLAQAMPHHVWTALPNGLLDWFNGRAYEYSGAATGTLDAQRWASIIHPEDREAAAEHWSAALASGDQYQVEYRVRGADGAYRWHLTRALPIRDDAGAIIRWIGTNTDIHERKIAEAESTRERDRIWSSTNDLMGTAGTDGFIKSVNPAWKRVLGYETEEILFRPFHEIIDPPDRQKAADAVRHLASGEPAANLEIALVHKDGSRSVIAWSAEPSGDVFYIVGRNVTEQRTVEEALRQSQKMEAVGQLTGGLAHDFNNLLTGISGSLELLQTRIGQGRYDEIERFVNTAQAASKRAAALTHRLLAFSRRQTLDPKATNVNRLIAGMDELIRRTVGPHIEVEVVAAGGLWDTLVDQNQLENALLNLCINARDAMPDGGRLTVETGNRWLDDRTARERDLPPGQYISLCVSDNGTGMPPDVIARAFDPFFTTKPIGMGTGLGLSMIYGFARQSGGQVRIYSEVGQGSMVCLYLPRHFGRGEDTEFPSGPREAPRALVNETVLVVDDEPSIRMLIAEVLGELGYTAIEAADGASGMKVIQSDVRLDLLITDVGLPGGMNGRQVADAARGARPHLKVLFITGYAENAVVGNGHLDPGMSVMTKPFAMEALATRIRGIIEET